MWPFRKKAEPSFINITGFTERRMMSWEEVEALGKIGAKTLSTWAELKRQRREEKKMKLTIGNEYLMSNGLKHKAVACTGHCVTLGQYHYQEDCAEPFPCNSHAPRVLHELLAPAPAPLRLEVGCLYALSDGSVEWCERISHKGVYRLGRHHYWVSGSATLSTPSAPRILHRIKLNEPVSGGDTAAYRECTAEYIQGFAERMGISVPAVQGEPDRMRVTYHVEHTETGLCKREAVVPPGYERVYVLGPQEWREALCEDDGFWVPYDGRSAFTIRPIAKPFKVEGDGWFRSRDGSWIKMTNESTGSECEGWYDNGKHASGDPDLDLVAKATPAQAALLDSL